MTKRADYFQEAGVQQKPKKQTVPLQKVYQCISWRNRAVILEVNAETDFKLLNDKIPSIS